MRTPAMSTSIMTRPAGVQPGSVFSMPRTDTKLPTQPEVPPPPPVVHFDYDELEAEGSECQCALCESYRTTFATYNDHRIMCKGHARSCSCYLCTQKNEVQLSYLAALSQRDTYCELSYLTVGRDRR